MADADPSARPAAAPARRPGQRDLTVGPIGPTLLAFALPTLASNVLQSLNGSINAIWVGRFLGEGALAATSNANIIMFLMFGAVFGFGMAATIMIGQSFGRRDIDGARRIFGTGIGLVAGVAVVVAALGWVFAPDILRLLATPGAAMPLALSYLRVIFLGLPASMLLVVMMMGLRGSGDSLTPLWFMGLSVLLDSGLNPVFIAGLGPAPRLGIAGSALATLIANHVSLLCLVLYVAWRDLPLRLRGAQMRYIIPDRALTGMIVRKGLAMGAQMIVVSVAGLSMIGLVNRYGVETAAAYGVSQQLWTYIQMPAMAVGAAVSSMAAQNIGAGQWDRVFGVTRAGILINLALTGVLVLLTLTFDRAVMALFLGADSSALPIARHIQVLTNWSFVLFGVAMVMMSTVRANGAVIAPLIVLLIGLFPIRIGFALTMRARLGVDALWWSFSLGSFAIMALTAAHYRFGDWRRGRLSTPIASDEAHERALGTIEPGGRLSPAG